MVQILLTSLLVWIPCTVAGRERHGRDFVSSTLDRRALTPLKILPMGDSITQGYRSSDSNGYRLDLLKDLQHGRYQVTYVGNKKSGSMVNNAEDGYDGYTIKQIASAIPDSLNFQPNVVLLHAGTNDMNKSPPPDPYAGAPDRLGSLIDEILCKCPNTTLIVAQIISSTNANTQSRIKTYNAAIPGVVAARRKKGFKVMTVDMSSMKTLNDSLHPTDDGYNQMASFWYKAIKEATSKDWITTISPETFTKTGDAQLCASGLFWTPVHNGKSIASGVGKGGGFTFNHAWKLFEQASKGIPDQDGKIIQFGDLDGDGKDEYIWIDSTSGAVGAYKNQWNADSNKPGWTPINGGKQIVSAGGKGSHVRIADVTGNGKADVLYLSDRGAVTLYQNLGPKGDGWAWDGGKEIASDVPDATATNVFFADINGDGRADYLLLHNDGSLDIRLNIGDYGSSNITWHSSGQVVSGSGTNNVTLADIDGDGRADYLLFNKTGGIGGYLNKRSDNEGHPIWMRQEIEKAIVSGPAPPYGNIRMADINGDGKADYVVVDDTSGAIDVYINDGHASTWTVGDGVHLIDMDGDGIDDYVQINDQGQLTVYRNGGPKSKEAKSSDKPWIWYPQNGGFAVAPVEGVPPSHIRIADLDGDGKADYIVVEPKTGAASWYKNGGPRKCGGWNWSPKGKVAAGFGSGAGVTFADINGDGRADYIWLDEKGAAIVYINAIGVVSQNWTSTNGGKPIATGVGASRDTVRFADVNGDGKADYIVVSTLTGDATAYHNGGPNKDSTGGWVWRPQGRIASGIGSSGPDTIFGRLDGSGRASYVTVSSNNGSIVAYLNGCKSLAPVTSSASSGDAEGTGKCGKPPLA